MESTTVSMRVGSCHETTDPVVDAHAEEAGGDALGPVAELAEGDRLAVRRDEHGVVGRRRGAAVDELPHGAGAGEYLARGHGPSFRDPSHSSWWRSWRVGVRPARAAPTLSRPGDPAGAEWARGETPGAFGSPSARVGRPGAGAGRGGRPPAPGHLVVGVAVAVVLLAWFALANLRKVQIDFWVFHRQAPLILVIVISGLLGALITALIMRRKPKA